MHYCKEMARKCWSDLTRLETHKHIKSIQRWERIYLEEGKKRLMKERRGCSRERYSGRTIRSGTRFIRRAISGANAMWRTATRSRIRLRKRSSLRRADLHSIRRMRSKNLISDASKTKRCGRRRKRGCGKSLEWKRIQSTAENCLLARLCGLRRKKILPYSAKNIFAQSKRFRKELTAFGKSSKSSWTKKTVSATGRHSAGSISGKHA